MNSDNIGDIVERMAAGGRVAEAVRLLQAKSRDGVAEADFVQGLWLLSGRYVSRRLSEARRAFQQAAERGHDRARSVYLAFVANGTGAPADWQEALALLRDWSSRDRHAAHQLTVIEAMALADDGKPTKMPEAEPLSAAPQIRLFRRLFTARECEYLIAVAGPLFEPSVVIDPRSGVPIRDPVRSSDVAGFALALEDPVIHALNRRIAAASGTDVRQGEPLQILRYRRGQEFKPHLDVLPSGDNQRVLTTLVLLNSEFSGGETEFLSAGLKWKGAVGDAIIFANVQEDGQPDMRARHAGRPVIAGEKLLASRWIRRKPLDLGDMR